MNPVDRLGEIRQQIRDLLRERRQIKSLIMSGDIATRGERFTAFIEQRLIVRAREPQPQLAVSHGWDVV